MSDRLNPVIRAFESGQPAFATFSQASPENASAAIAPSCACSTRTRVSTAPSATTCTEPRASADGPLARGLRRLFGPRH